ncbi:MAG: thymidine phosphorylase [Candidatus Krumholzibacteria bacterium]|nr:thymidine phosphorylase [Candidatus Krumholzibacteria bacterium]
MNAHELIRRKRDGLSLDEEEIRFLVSAYLKGEVGDYQMAAFLMATAIRGMTNAETVALTRVMMESGRVFDFDLLGAPVIDKHSTGGVGDKVSIPLVPIAVECGLAVPMISGRSLGATGGTLDKLESIPGLRTDLDPDRFARQVGELGACFGAQTEEIVPADRKLYALRDATATVESVPLIVSSILSKKFAEGVHGVVIDVKCGSGAFMRTSSDARELAGALEAVGASMGKAVKTVLTSMDEPLGRTIGNALEMEEAIRVLKGSGPPDVTALAYRLVAEMLRLGGIVPDISSGETLARSAVESGRAFDRFMNIVAAQCGKLDPDAAGFGLPRSKVVNTLVSRARGFISRIDARIVGETVRELGGGRFGKDDAIDHSVGVVLLSVRGDEVAEGDALIEIHASGEDAARNAARRLSDAIFISAGPVPPASLYLVP